MGAEDVVCAVGCGGGDACGACVASAPVDGEAAGEHGGGLAEDVAGVGRHELADLAGLAECDRAEAMLHALCQQQADLQDGGPPPLLQGDAGRAVTTLQTESPVGHTSGTRHMHGLHARPELGAYTMLSQAQGGGENELMEGVNQDTGTMFDRAIQWSTPRDHGRCTGERKARRGVTTRKAGWMQPFEQHEEHIS